MTRLNGIYVNIVHMKADDNQICLGRLRLASSVQTRPMPASEVARICKHNFTHDTPYKRIWLDRAEAQYLEPQA